MAVDRSRVFRPLETPEPEAPEMEMEMDAGETLSMSLLGGKDVKPGDVVRIRVQSVNDEDGTWQGVYAEEAAEDMGVEESVDASFAPKGMM